MFVPDSISQIAIGLLGSLISYRVFNYYAPYVEEDDGVVSEVAQAELVLVFFYALMVFATDNLEQHDGVFSGKVFASLLVVLLASTLLIAVRLIILAIFSGNLAIFITGIVGASMVLCCATRCDSTAKVKPCNVLPSA